jgi:hypothetical protein
LGRAFGHPCGYLGKLKGKTRSTWKQLSISGRTGLSVTLHMSTKIPQCCTSFLWLYFGPVSSCFVKKSRASSEFPPAVFVMRHSSSPLPGIKAQQVTLPLHSPPPGFSRPPSPSLILPFAGVHLRETLWLSSPSSLSMCPMYFHLRVRIWVLTFCTPAILLTSSLLIRVGQYIFSTLLRQVWTNTSNLCSSAAVIFQVVQPYKSTETTLGWKILIFVQIFLSLYNACLALPILLFISSVAPPVVVTVAPRYVNLHILDILITNLESSTLH